MSGFMAAVRRYAVVRLVKESEEQAHDEQTRASVRRFRRFRRVQRNRARAGAQVPSTKRTGGLDAGPLTVLPTANRNAE